MINLIKMMIASIVSVFASLFKGIGAVFNSIGTVMTPGSDSKKERMQYNFAEVEVDGTKQTAREKSNENGSQTALVKTAK